MHARISARLIVPCLLVVLAPLHAEEAAPPKELVVIDLRPAEEKEGTGLTELTGKCNQDVFRIADVATDPLKVDVLKSDLVQALADGGAGKTLAVLNWSIYYNKTVSGGGGPKITSVGVGGYSIPTGKKKERQPGSRCSQRESAGGWYTGGELHSVYYPLVSEFEGTYGGKAIHARVVYSPSRKLEGRFAGDATDTEALLEAVHQTSEQVALAIAN